MGWGRQGSRGREGQGGAWGCLRSAAPRAARPGSLVGVTEEGGRAGPQRLQPGLVCSAPARPAAFGVEVAGGCGCGAWGLGPRGRPRAPLFAHKNAKMNNAISSARVDFNWGPLISHALTDGAG